MIYRNWRHRYCLLALLFCIMWIAGIDVFAQSAVQQPATSVPTDTIPVREAPKARARRNRADGHAAYTDSIIAKRMAEQNERMEAKAKAALHDTLPALANDTLAELSSQADSIAKENKIKLEKQEQHISMEIPADSLLQKEAPAENKKVWIPNSTKSTWLAVVFPGAGQIYNRKYWKLPIIYGGFAGCAYALTWNNKMYSDYSQAYLDIMDSDPSTDSYLDLFPNRVSSYSESQLTSLLKKRKDTFRRYRDLSIFAFIGVYLISIVDAYVDAELSNFDITPDLSMHFEPAVINDNHNRNTKSVGLQCSLRF